MFTLYRIAFAPPRKSYRIELLFSYENFWLRNICDGAEQRRNDQISKRCSHYTRLLFVAPENHIGLRFCSHIKNCCGGAISVKEGSCAAPCRSLISDRCSHYIGQLFVAPRKAVRYSVNVTLNSRGFIAKICSRHRFPPLRNLRALLSVLRSKVIVLTLIFFFFKNKNALIAGSVSLAWRLDREMRRRLFLHETAFTRWRFFTSYFIYVDTFCLFLNWFSTCVSDDRKYVCGRRQNECINTRKFKGLDSREISSLPAIKKVIYIGHVISIIAENKPHAYYKGLICIQWKSTTPDHRSFAS